MTASIPASQLANVVPGVLSAGGNPLSLNAVFLTQDTSIPIGQALSFPSAVAVSDWFGPNAAETTLANVYFAGFTNCTVLPSALYFYQYNTAPVAAYLRGGSVAALSLAQLQALSGTLVVTIDGQVNTSSAINLSAATSFSNAASTIQTGLQSSTAVFSGSGSQAAGVLTITATASGSLAIGNVVTGAGVDGGTATVISFGTYTPAAGTGTVNVSTSGTTSSGAVDVAGSALVTYDTLREAFVITDGLTTGATSTIGFATAGTLANGLNLTAVLGAVTSQGAAASTPAATMAGVVASTQNWATFATVAEQSLSNKEAFAAWVQTTSNRYLYCCQDSDLTPINNPDATGSFGNIVNAADDTGILPIHDISGTGVLAAFACGVAASINFQQQNGRTVIAFRGQSGLAAQVKNQTYYDNLVANGYSCYAAFATADQQFVQFQPGAVSGPFLWFDTYINQIWLNAALQLAIMELLQTVPSVPYVTRGYNLIRSALVGSAASSNSPPTGPITAALYFGAIVPGVTLSGTQSAALNSATGDPGATATIQNTGWYLQILDPGSIVRGQRGSPVINFWYTDGGSVQKISMSSVDVL